MENYFLKVIEHMREHEEVVLYEYSLNISDKDCHEASEYLKQQYFLEALTYPCQNIPAFDAAAALWAAKIAYRAAQFILYREHHQEELFALFGEPQPPVLNTSSVLSADLCLRFVTEMITPIKQIDSEDPLIDVLESILMRWHYSAIQHPFDCNKLQFDYIVDDTLLQTLYINRVILLEKIELACCDALRPIVKAHLGIHGADLWKEFKIRNQKHES